MIIRGLTGQKVQNVEFNSKNSCVALQKDGEAFLCPQRLHRWGRDRHQDWPWLVDSVNAVELDEYYTM